jgi:hypothetical protein
MAVPGHLRGATKRDGNVQRRRSSPQEDRPRDSPTRRPQSRSGTVATPHLRSAPHIAVKRLRLCSAEDLHTLLELADTVSGGPGMWGVVGVKGIEVATAERSDLADFLTTLQPEQWQAASLCEGWRVRDVVAHVMSFDRVSLLGMSANSTCRQPAAYQRQFGTAPPPTPED